MKRINCVHYFLTDLILKGRMIKIKSDVKREERNWNENADEEILDHYISMAERAVSEMKKAEDYDDMLFWFKVTERCKIRFSKALKKTEKSS